MYWSLENVPWTNLHDLNLDWIVNTMKETVEQWIAYRLEMNQNYTDFTENIELWKTEVEENFDELQTYVHDYFDNLDLDESTRHVIDQMIASGEFIQVLSPSISNSVSDWLSEHVTPTTPVVDDTLTISGAAADAFVTGRVRAQLNYGANNRNYVLLSYTKVDGQSINHTTGAFVENANWTRTDYIEVDPSKDMYYQISGRTQYCACYDENHNFLRNFVLSQGTHRTCFFPATKYIAISAATSVFKSLFISYGAYDNLKSQVDNLNAFTDNIFTGVKWYCATINDNGELVDSWVRLTSEEIPVIADTTLEFSFHDSIYQIWLAFYNSNHQHLVDSAIFASNRTLLIPKNSAYMRCVVANKNDLQAWVYPDDAYNLDILCTAYKHTPLKIITYNTGHYGYGTAYGPPPDVYDEKLLNWRKFFGELNADIACLQEYSSTFNREWQTNRVESDDVLWDYFFTHKIQTGAQTAIKSKHPMRSAANNQLSTGRYYSQAVINGVFVMSVHLSVGVDNVQTRRTEAQEILAILQNHPTFVLCGDFNTEPGEEDGFFKIFADAGFNLANYRPNLPGSASYIEGEDTERGFFGKCYTWSNNRNDFYHYDVPTGTMIYYLDNIITSANIKIINTYPLPWAYGMLSSDHIPIFAEIEVQ